MTTEPLGNTFITVTFELDANAEKMIVKNIKQVTKKISKQMKQQISKDVAEGVKEGAEQGGKAIKGRLGFAGAGILGPFRPDVMLAYTGARYMHMLLTRFVFNPIENTLSYYWNRKKEGFENRGVKPTEDTLKELEAMRDIIPSITAKLGLFLGEITKGTKVDAIDIVEELKKMINQGKAQNVSEAFEKYRGILTMSETQREKALSAFGGSASIAENLRHGNVTPNLLSYLNNNDFERYALSFENMMMANKSKETAEYRLKAEGIRSGLIDMVEEDLYKTMQKEINDLKKANKSALEYPDSFRYYWKHRALMEPKTLEEAEQQFQQSLERSKVYQDTQKNRIERYGEKYNNYNIKDVFSDMLKYLREIARLARESEKRKVFEDKAT